MRDGRELAPQELPMQRAAAGGLPVANAEFDLVRGDGRVVKFFGNAAPLFDEHGKPRAVGAFMDIAELKRTQAELEQATQAAEAANLAKSRFLANMSHELRTPMNAILGMTDLALSEQLPATVRDYLQTAKESADLLLELLNEILDFSRIEAGRFDLESMPFSLGKTVEQVVKTLSIPPTRRDWNWCTKWPTRRRIFSWAIPCGYGRC